MGLTVLIIREKLHIVSLLFDTVLRSKTAIEAFSSKLLPFAQFTMHTLLNKNKNGKKAVYPNVRRRACISNNF